MKVEMKALNENNTWEKCAMPQGKKLVGCRWVFTIKYKPDGTIERYKARLVAKGYTQTHGIDYSETFSPVAKIDTIRVHHMEAVMRIIRYLKKIAGNGVVFKKNGHLEAQIYTDASWAGEKGDRRSTSGFFTIVGGNLVAWKSKKQKVVSLSSAESEFRGIAKGVVEALWI
ncbi:secreted RxLR effector protein 161-like [Rutidosis leptorrhynchoides]|uniref:secreted RxLR effector protein 161-like n=1 Tax=Rutidosis leptorrhynchoides TaxID=125765 RepID=UPI003A990633